MFPSIPRVFIRNNGRPQLVFRARIHTVYGDGRAIATLPDGLDWHTPQKLYIVFQDYASPDRFFYRWRPGVLIVANDFVAAGLDSPPVLIEDGRLVTARIPVYDCVFRSYRVYTGRDPVYEPVDECVGEPSGLCERVRRVLRRI